MADHRAKSRKAILNEIGRLIKACRTKSLELADLTTLRDLIATRGEMDTPKQGELALGAGKGVDRASWMRGAASGNPLA